MILKTHRDWLTTVADLPESDLPCNSSTVAYAVEVAKAAVAAHDALSEAMDQLVGSLMDEEVARVPECEFRDILTAERCSDFRCSPYHVHMPDGQIRERWLCPLHAFLLAPEATPA